MDKLISHMLLTLSLSTAARALRNPERFEAPAIESLAHILEDLAHQTKGMLTGELMEDAVRETTTKEGE